VMKARVLVDKHVLRFEARDFSFAMFEVEGLVGLRDGWIS